MAGSMKLALVLAVAIVVIAGSMSSTEGITCGQVSGALAPCINYLKSGVGPTSQCCNGVKSLNNAAKTTADRRQACSCIKSAAGSISGISPKYTEALPGKCNVNIPYKLSLNTNCNSIK